MHIELVTFKSKTWGIVELPYEPGHFHTGWEGSWPGSRWELARQIGTPKDNMRIGTNAIISGDFLVVGWSRGRSAANFNGHFRDHSAISYELSMDGTGDLWDLVQSGIFPLTDGYITGQFTFSKNGQNIFLKPMRPNL